MVPSCAHLSGLLAGKISGTHFSTQPSGCCLVVRDLQVSCYTGFLIVHPHGGPNVRPLPGALPPACHPRQVVVSALVEAPAVVFRLFAGER